MRRAGFTLIELMIAVAIISILAAIAVPQFAQVMRKSREASTKGNLATIRSALSIYFADTEGQMPGDRLQSLTAGGRYMNRMPDADTVVWHKKGNRVGVGDMTGLIASNANTVQWWYFNNVTDPQWGMLLVNCIHQDVRGKSWTDY
jgi:prepilin-type N-terminal cleavage/methylation domain-containing protein